MKRIVILSIFLIFLFVFNIGMVVGVEDGPGPVGLEGEYPLIDGVTVDEETQLPEYIEYIVRILIFTSIAVTLFALVRGGVLWISSQGDPTKIKDSKEQFLSAVMGLIIVLSSFVFLSTISPDLVEIDHKEELEDRREDVVNGDIFFGIYLSKDENISQYEDNIDNLREYLREDTKEDIFEGAVEGKRVYRKESSIWDLDDLSKEINSIVIVNPVNEEGELIGYYYGVVLHSEVGRRGKCEFIVNKETEPKIVNAGDFNASGDFSSMTVVQISTEEKPRRRGDHLTLYERPYFDIEYDSQKIMGKKEGDSKENIEFGFGIGAFYPIEIDGVWSIERSGNFGLILTSNSKWDTGGWNDNTNDCAVFLETRSQPDLKNHHINKCNRREPKPFLINYDSCVKNEGFYSLFPIFE